jgi:hypothetical protein
MAGRLIDRSTGRGVPGVLVQARPTIDAAVPSVETCRGGWFLIRPLVGDLVDEEYTVCVDGTAVAYQAGQVSGITMNVEGSSCDEGMGTSMTGGWLGDIGIQRLP